MSPRFLLALALLAARLAAMPPTVAPPTASASSEQADGPASGALDGDRFSADMRRAWKGAPGATNWTWTLDLGRVQAVGAILQVVGSHGFVLRDAPRDYAWEWSRDGRSWRAVPGGSVSGEKRLYRVTRPVRAVTARYLRMRVDAATGAFPCVREVEVRAGRDADFGFPDWVLAVNMTHDGALPGHGREFLPLARAARPGLAAQQVWLVDFDPAFLAVEPRPLAAFLSGSFKDWCEVDRTHWVGTEKVLAEGRTPMWASCGGAQGLAILSEVGTSRPWDCPHCRVARPGVVPIYTHIGHFGFRACGDYGGCVFERGPHRIRKVGDDPVFRALPDEFEAMESHCGQIDHAPAGWDLVATAGGGTLTRVQCLRRRGVPVYAAQFHIEMDGAPATSRAIMAAFLGEAERWRRGGECGVSGVWARPAKLPAPDERREGGGPHAEQGGGAGRAVDAAAGAGER